MEARPGDRVVIAAKKIGQARRSGEVTRVEGGSGHERLWVHWDDGHESMFVPSAGVTVEPTGSSSP